MIALFENMIVTYSYPVVYLLLYFYAKHEKLNKNFEEEVQWYKWIGSLIRNFNTKNDIKPEKKFGIKHLIALMCGIKEYFENIPENTIERQINNLIEDIVLNCELYFKEQKKTFLSICKNYKPKIIKKYILGIVSEN